MSSHGDGAAGRGRRRRCPPRRRGWRRGYAQCISSLGARSAESDEVSRQAARGGERDTMDRGPRWDRRHLDLGCALDGLFERARHGDDDGRHRDRAAGTGERENGRIQGGGGSAGRGRWADRAVFWCCPRCRLSGWSAGRGWELAGHGFLVGRPGTSALTTAPPTGLANCGIGHGGLLAHR